MLNLKSKKLVSILLITVVVTVFGVLATAQNNVYVRTIKQQYTVGETITINYYTSRSCYVNLTVYKPNGGVVTVVNNWVYGGTHFATRTAGNPPGQRRVVLQACDAYAETQFTVVSSWFPIPSPSPSPGNLPSLPPFPGIDYGDLGQGQYHVLGISPSLFPSGFRTVFRGTQFRITISQIDTSRYTTVRLAEWIPGSGWTVYNFNGWYPNGSRSTNFYAGRRGAHYLIGWVDNNHNGFVDFGELTIPWLTVVVQ